MKYLDEFRDSKLAKSLIGELQKAVTKPMGMPSALPYVVQRPAVQQLTPFRVPTHSRSGSPGSWVRCRV